MIKTTYLTGAVIAGLSLTGLASTASSQTSTLIKKPNISRNIQVKPTVRGGAPSLVACPDNVSRKSIRVSVLAFRGSGTQVVGAVVDLKKGRTVIKRNQDTFNGKVQFNGLCPGQYTAIIHGKNGAQSPINSGGDYFKTKGVRFTISPRLVSSMTVQARLDPLFNDIFITKASRFSPDIGRNWIPGDRVILSRGILKPVQILSPTEYKIRVQCCKPIEVIIRNDRGQTRMNRPLVVDLSPTSPTNVRHTVPMDILSRVPNLGNRTLTIDPQGRSNMITREFPRYAEIFPRFIDVRTSRQDLNNKIKTTQPAGGQMVPWGSTLRVYVYKFVRQAKS